MDGMPRQYRATPTARPSTKAETLGMPDTMVATTLAWADTKSFSGPNASAP